MTNTTTGELKRSLGLFALIAYGIGDILGAGIYSLVGKVVGLIGPAAWISFLMSFVVAAFTGLSYAELGSRFPRSAGTAVFSLEAFRNRGFSYLIGFLVMLSGIVSMATVSRAFAGYLDGVYPELNHTLTIILFFSVLAAINFWGIESFSRANIFCTIIEVAGLGIVILAGAKYFGSVNYFSMTPEAGTQPVFLLLQGGLLTFYAFIGFEDLVNVADEAKDPSRNIPRAILIALGFAALVYILVVFSAVSTVPPQELASSSAPLMLVVERGLPMIPKEIFLAVALLAVSNTALGNFVMSSRLLYGMAREGLAPKVFGEVHQGRMTPHIAIGFVLLVAIALAFTRELTVLAQATSLLLLSVFLVMNSSLMVIKLRLSNVKAPFQVPFWVPMAGAVCCLGLIFYVKREAFLTVFMLIFFGFLFYGIQKLLKIKFRRR